MGMKKRVAAQSLLILLLGVTAHAQGKQHKPDLAEPYWLKYSLIFFDGCAPRVFPDNITFTEGECSVSPYDGRIESRGTQVLIRSIKEEKGFARVIFSYWPVEMVEGKRKFEVLLKTGAKKGYGESFDLLFSKVEVASEYECPDEEIKTKKQLIQCVGFPIYVTRDGDVESYHYILEFAGPSNPFAMYDRFTVEIKKKKVINVSGYI